MNEASPHSGQNGKRRRLQGACDACRKKKGEPMSRQLFLVSYSDYFCSSITQAACTHDRATVKARTRKIQRMETWTPPPRRTKSAQEYVADILSTSTVYIPSDDPHTSHQILVEVAQYARRLEDTVATLQANPNVPVISSSNDAASPAGTDDSDTSETRDSPLIKDALNGLIPSFTDKSGPFYGRSSSIQFTKSLVSQMPGNAKHAFGVRRLEFWAAQPYFFPDDDLLKRLVKIFFEQINPLISILHFPSFHQSLTSGLHFRDPSFGAVVLAVCALGSRYSDDPRVFLDGTNSEHSCGWKWFRQVRPVRTPYSPAPSLEQLQLLCLSVLFLAGSCAPEEGWILAGLGIRFAQGAGIHHRSGYSGMDPLEAELYKRVFWLLVIMDTLISSFKGRPRMTNDADIDIDLPLECDEEWWGTPNAIQPLGIPSSSIFIVTYLKLLKIFGRIQGAVYAVNGQPCSPDVIAELDSDLNAWVDNVPSHCVPRPIGCFIYHLLPRANTNSPAIHTRSGEYLDLQLSLRLPFALMQPDRAATSWMFNPVADVTALFDCAVVLLINVWAVVGGRKSRTPEDFERATADVQNCMRVLRLYERRWRAAGRKCDIISALLTIGKFTSSSSLKRPRDGEDVIGLSPPSDASMDNRADRPIAGSLRVLSVVQQIQALELSIQETDHLFSLPLHTEELGRLPIYTSFDYDLQASLQPDNMQYQPQSHLHLQDQASGLLSPELMYGFDDVTQGSIFPTMPNVTGWSADGAEASAFNVPSGDGWRDWSAYLASVEGLNLDTF
ncbi:fungal-specific transcription factor domain-containing protein [Mycena crocata]|nr:fungal-specific transcription factor domain-containing protein [Mycena crocata]